MSKTQYIELAKITTECLQTRVALNLATVTCPPCEPGGSLKPLYKLA